MKKYSRIYDAVCRPTDDPIWRTFFIALLMAETEAEREVIDRRFWQEVENPDEAAQQKIRAGFDQNFRQLLPMIREFSAQVDEVIGKRTALAA